MRAPTPGVFYPGPLTASWWWPNAIWGAIMPGTENVAYEHE